MDFLKSQLTRFHIVSLFTFLLLLLAPQSIGAQATQIQATAQNTQQEHKKSDQAIIILRTDTITEMNAIRAVIEKKGGRIQEIFPPRIFIATIPQAIKEDLEHLDFIEMVSYDPIDLQLYRDDAFDSSFQNGLEIWNQRKNPSKVTAVTEKEAFLTETPPVVPKDLPKNKKEKDDKEKAYKVKWQKAKKELLHQDQEKRLKRLQTQRKSKATEDQLYKSIIGYTPQESLSVEPQTISASSEAQAMSASANSFGATTGAGLYDTSSYMIGNITVAVFFVPGTSGAWTSTNINTAFQSVVSALNQLTSLEPNAHISFTYIKEVDTNGTPNPLPTDNREYVNDLRNIYNTHWAYMITIANGSGRANADLNGPAFRLFSLGGVVSSGTVRHEMMHIFGAMDQYYPDAARSPIDRWGYLDVVNANAQYNDGKGFFSGKGEGQDDIMISNSNVIGPYTRGQIGWRDTNGNGVFDPQDTYPKTAIVSSGNNPYIITGQSNDMPLPNELSSSTFNSVSINTIKNVEYRINNGAWTPVQPLDGAFNSGKEDFSFTTPVLPNGAYTLEVRAINSNGNIEKVYATEKFSVTGSPVVNTPPSASLNITPPLGSIETSFLLDSSGSSDLQNDLSNLEVRWDFENDGIWDTSFSSDKQITYSYASAGTKTIKLEIKDQNGTTSTISKTVEVASTNLSPIPSFTVTPENRHGDNFDMFPVMMDAGSSYDPEDNISELQVRWDFDSDGIWDTGYLNEKQIQHNYPIAQRYKMTFFNLLGNGSNNQSIFVSGNYVYVGGNPFTIVDVSDPTNPIIKGTLTLPGAADISISGNYAYIVDNVSSLHIVNVSNPAAPSLISSHALTIAPFGVAVSGNYAYVADRNAGLVVIDVTNPTSPLRRGALPTTDARKVFVKDQYAYVADSIAGLKIIDISNPDNLSLVGTFNTPGVADGIYVQGNLAYVADGSSGIQIFDVSLPSNPRLIGNYNTLGSAKDISLSGNYAFIADENGGISIVDVSNPLAPNLVDRIDYIGTTYQTGVNSQGAFITNGSRLITLNFATLNSVPITKQWKVTLQLKDAQGNLSQATRNVWAATYNRPPAISSIEALETNGAWFELLNTYTNDYQIQKIFVSGQYLYMLYYENAGQNYFGFKIFDISNPESPVPVGGTYRSTGNKGGIFISGNYAYITDQLIEKGLKILDLSDINNPVLVGTYATPASADNVKVYGNYAYLVAGQLYILDVSNPSSPQLTATYTNGSNVTDVIVKDNYAYLTSTGGLDILDITNPASPSVRGRVSNSLHGIIDIDEHYLYSFGHSPSFSSIIKIFDINDPNLPALLGTYQSPESISSAIKWNNFIFIGNSFFKRMDIIDVSDVYIPKFISQYAGAYSATMVFSQDLIYSSDISNTKQLFTFRPNLGKLARVIDSQDPDINTSWDGLLEYHWDFENDGTWDTPYASNLNSVVFPRLKQGQNLICEIKDRFHATARTELTIPPINNPPVMDGIGDKTVNEGQELSFQVSANDPDTQDVLDYTVSPLPLGASFDTTTHIFRWTPNFDQAGSYLLTFSVSDGNLQVSETITITVRNINQPPVVTAIPDQTVVVSQTVNFNASASSDPDCGTTCLTYSWDFGDGSANTSGVSVSHSYSTLGNYTVTLTVSDGELSASDTALVTVTGANIVLNPNFESANTSWTGLKTPVKLVTVSPFEGATSVEMTLVARAILNLTQIVSPVTAGKKYQAKAAIKTAAVTSQSYVQLEWRKAGGTIIRTDTFGQTSGTSAWAVKTSPVFIAPTGAAKVTVKLISNKGTGKAYFDAVELKQVP